VSEKTNTFGLTGVNHVITVVRDVERALHFYRDLLGIRQIEVMQPGVGPDRMVWLQLPSGIMLHIIRSETVPVPRPIHIAFEVSDFDRAMAGAKAQGWEILQSGTRNDGQQFLFFHDPDGNRVELCTRGRQQV
jgi:glyoxylase I family protein